MHIILLGDSVFDNQAYIGGELDVVGQLRVLLPPDARATLLAIDGSLIETVFAQLRRLPGNATHLVISAGGNNLIGHLHRFADPVTSPTEALLLLDALVASFRQHYRHLLATVRDYDLPTLVCTLYNPRFPDETMRIATRTALSIFNDAIMQEAAAARLPVLDLRQVCTGDADFANPIEPSAHGGAKIAHAVLRALQQHDFRQTRTVIYGIERGIFTGDAGQRRYCPLSG